MNKIRNVNQTSPSGAHVAEAPNTADKPNFIIILVDDMGYAGVSCFEAIRISSPRKSIAWRPRGIDSHRSRHDALDVRRPC